MKSIKEKKMLFLETTREKYINELNLTIDSFFLHYFDALMSLSINKYSKFN